MNKINEEKIITFGCRLNTFESEVMRKHADKAGLKNYIIINSCAVTGEAERQARQEIRKQRKANPDKIIILTGCSAQASKDYYKDMPEIDFAFGNNEKLQLETWQIATNELKKPADQRQKILIGAIDGVAINDARIPNEADIFGNNLKEILVSDFKEKTKAFVQIQRGCRNKCSFCLISIIRGKNHSYSQENIVRQCQELVQNGYKEIAITGVDIASYGADFKENKYHPMDASNLTDLLKAILKEMPKDEISIRLSSLDPALNYDSLIALMKADKRIAPFFHISLQNGDNDILQKMRRRHTREHIIKLCEKLRTELGENLMIGADVITGFPTETEENFDNTYKLIKECAIANMHVFPYSERKGTFAAAQWKDDVNGKDKKLRAKILRDLGNENLVKFIEQQTPLPIKVLIEEKGNQGWSNNYIHCEIADGKTFPENTIVEGKIIKIRNTTAIVKVN